MSTIKRNTFAFGHYKGEDAISRVRGIATGFRLENNIACWELEDALECIILFKGTTAVSFALLHAIKNDPLGKLNDPSIIDFIYTFEEHRKCGYALWLAKHINNIRQVAYIQCMNKESSVVFRKAGYQHVANPRALWGRMSKHLEEAQYMGQFMSVYRSDI